MKKVICLVVNRKYLALFHLTISTPLSFVFRDMKIVRLFSQGNEKIRIKNLKKFKKITLKLDK